MALRDYYTRLALPQHQGRVKYMQMLDLLLRSSDEVYDVAIDIDDDHDVDKAVGVQLDKLSDIVGVSRQVVYNPIAGQSSILDDYSFRMLLKSKICQNSWAGGAEDLMEQWKEIFPDHVVGISDNQDMTIDVYVVGPTNSILRELVAKGYIVPKPAGVRVNYFSQEHPLFAYDLDTPSLGGYDKGYWTEEITQHPTFSYETETVDQQGYDAGYWI